MRMVTTETSTARVVVWFSCEETARITRMEGSNPELTFDWILEANNLSKESCLSRIVEAGIPLPVMYRLGFKNNNCIGCVKATSIAYWRSIREHFPEVFATRARQSRELGVRLTRLKGQRIFIDEIPKDQPMLPITEDVSCGPDCAVNE